MFVAVLGEPSAQLCNGDHLDVDLILHVCFVNELYGDIWRVCFRLYNGNGCGALFYA